MAEGGGPSPLVIVGVLVALLVVFVGLAVVGFLFLLFVAPMFSYLLLA